MTAPTGEPTTAPGAPAGTAPTAPAPTPAAPAVPAAPNPWEGFAWDGKVESLPEPVAKAITDLRKENGAARTTAKQQAAQEARNELLASVAEALGLSNAEPPSAEALTQHLADSQAEAASMAAQMRIYSVAAGIDGMTLADVADFLDSNRIAAEIDAIADQIQPGDVATFDAKVAEIMQRWRAGRPQPAAAVASRTPVAALRPGALPGSAQVSLDDQIAEAQKTGNWRAVIALQNRKIQPQ